MNAMHSSMKITDDFYPNLDESEVQNRINTLGKEIQTDANDVNSVGLLMEFIAWKHKNKRSNDIT